MELAVTIPPNTTATVTLPYAKAGATTEGGTAISGQSFYSQVAEDDSGVTLELGSGNYVFRYPFNIDILPDLPVTKADSGRKW